ncbi:mRNA cap guanine-N7 methyltransferase [Echinococcus granulosus]|nr:mRNA cap guanine-N7 methyltransferase [Echinococcus granulosus]EUB62891.1 mRNA cap guanine-N7 methyltransferase [Echinococcus granulosus]
MDDIGSGTSPKFDKSPNESDGFNCVKGFYDAAAKDKTNCSLLQRRRSRIYYMRNLSNWIKGTLISRYLDLVYEKKQGNRVNILDLCCGKGGDQKKWQVGCVDHVTFVDISAASIDICKERYNSLKCGNYRGRIFSADFIVHDCTAPLDLKRLYSVVSCQFALHYAFESIDKARTMLQNSSQALEEGGYFLVTVPNAYEILRRLNQSKDRRSFGNSVYSITFDELYTTHHPPPLFKARYHFQLEGVVDCPEHLVYPPLLIAMAKEVSLECIEGPLPFAAFMRRTAQDRPMNMHLLRTMDALEMWPSTHLSRHSLPLPSSPKRGSGHHDRSRSPIDRCGSTAGWRSGEESSVAASEVDAYAHVERRRYSLHLPVGTISKQEWEAFCTYCVFVFKKVVPNR